VRIGGEKGNGASLSISNAATTAPASRRGTEQGASALGGHVFRRRASAQRDELAQLAELRTPAAWELPLGVAGVHPGMGRLRMPGPIASKAQESVARS
jgi:hypothetical protein